VDIPFSSWQSIGRQLHLIHDSSAWWLADWLLYGETAFPDRYRKAITETSLDYQTLRNYAWVARKFVYSRRRDKLSFQHHAEVASLSPEQQDFWLDECERLNWSRNELRRQIRTARANHILDEPDDTPRVSIVVSIPSEKRQGWVDAATKAGLDLAQPSGNSSPSREAQGPVCPAGGTYRPLSPPVSAASGKPETPPSAPDTGRSHQYSVTGRAGLGRGSTPIRSGSRPERDALTDE